MSLRGSLCRTSCLTQHNQFYIVFHYVSNNLYSKFFLLHKEKQTITTSTLQSPILAVMTKKETIFIFLGVINKYEKYQYVPKLLCIPYNMTTQSKVGLIMHIWIRDFQFHYILATCVLAYALASTAL